MLRWLSVRSGALGAPGAEIVTALQAVAPAEMAEPLLRAKDFVTECLDVILSRSDDLAVSDLRSGVVPGVRTISWDVQLAAAVGDKERVIGFLPKVVFQIQTTTAREAPLTVEFDEQALDFFIEQMERARRELEAIRNATSPYLRVGGPYRSPEKSEEEGQ